MDIGYEFVYFDGLKRFYLSVEHPELKPRFDVGPNYFNADKQPAQDEPASRRRSGKMALGTQPTRGKRRQAGVGEQACRDLRPDVMAHDRPGSNFAPNRRLARSRNMVLGDFQTRHPAVAGGAAFRRPVCELSKRASSPCGARQADTPALSSAHQSATCRR